MSHLNHSRPVPELIMILARHGESVWNERGLAQGQAEAPGLTVRGREQSEALASSLIGAGARLVVSSDLLRATETALIVATRLKLPLLFDPGLRERNMGALEGQPVGPSASRMLGIDDGRVSNADRKPDGGETLRDFSRRVQGALRRLWRVHAPATVVLVTHGGVCRMARLLAEGGALGGMPWSDVDNGAVWIVRWPPLGGWLEAQHLAVEAQLLDEAPPEGLGPPEAM